MRRTSLGAGGSECWNSDAASGRADGDAIVPSRAGLPPIEIVRGSTVAGSGSGECRTLPATRRSMRYHAAPAQGLARAGRACSVDASLRRGRDPVRRRGLRAGRRFNDVLPPEGRGLESRTSRGFAPQPAGSHRHMPGGARAQFSRVRRAIGSDRLKPAHAGSSWALLAPGRFMLVLVGSAGPWPVYDGSGRPVTVPGRFMTVHTVSRRLRRVRFQPWHPLPADATLKPARPLPIPIHSGD